MFITYLHTTFHINYCCQSKSYMKILDSHHVTKKTLEKSCHTCQNLAWSVAPTWHIHAYTMPLLKSTKEFVYMLPGSKVDIQTAW